MKIEKGNISQSVTIPTSKSAANRLLMLAAKSKDEFTISGIPKSDDVINLIKALKQIGVQVIYSDDKTIRMKGPFPRCEISSEQVVNIDVGEGGTTARFLIPLLSLGKNIYLLNAHGRLSSRPMRDLYKALIKMDVNIDQKTSMSFPISICGPARVTPEIRVDSSLSSQFVSGMALAFWGHDTEVIPDNLSGSMPYYEMTLNYIRMAQAGICTFNVPLDFSSASYPIAMGVVTNGVTINNCEEVDWYQADAILLKIVNTIGGRWLIDKGSLQIFPSESLLPFEQDCSQCPDLAPTLCFLASYLKGESILLGLESLQLKESNRLEEMFRLLKLFQVEYKWDGERLSIQGRNPLDCAIEYLPPNDHRMVMTGYLFLKQNGGGTIGSIKSVSKSFPEFFTQMGEITCD